MSFKTKIIWEFSITPLQSTCLVILLSYVYWMLNNLFDDLCDIHIVLIWFKSQLLLWYWILFYLCWLFHFLLLLLWRKYIFLLNLALVNFLILIILHRNCLHTFIVLISWYFLMVLSWDKIYLFVASILILSGYKFVHWYQFKPRK